VAKLVRDETEAIPFYCPINEISYWAGGTVARFNPLARGRGLALKRQLVRAAIAAMEAIWRVDARVRIVQVDPLIHVIAQPGRPQDRAKAARYRRVQFQAWDMLAGRLWPELGGQHKYLDLLGVTYYAHNQ
jgi:hypothetical protein